VSQLSKMVAHLILYLTEYQNQIGFSITQRHRRCVIVFEPGKRPERGEIGTMTGGRIEQMQECEGQWDSSVSIASSVTFLHRRTCLQQIFQIFPNSHRITMDQAKD